MLVGKALCTILMRGEVTALNDVETPCCNEATEDWLKSSDMQTVEALQVREKEPQLLF